MSKIANTRPRTYALSLALPLAMSAALVVAPAACKKAQKGQESGQESGESEETGEAGKGKPIRIAVAGPMTGQYASFGQQMADGAKQAVADINAAGGVNGRQVKLEIGDDACDPKQAVAIANQFVQKGVVFVAGHWCSGSSIPASSVYEEEAILQISPGSTSPKLTEAGRDNVFRVCGRDDQQGVVAGKFIAEKYAGKKLAVLHDKTAYGKGLADETKKNAEAAGMQTTLYEAYTAGEKDYTAVVSKLKQNGIEILFIGGYHTESGLIVRQLRDQSMDTQVIVSDAVASEEFWSITGDKAQGTFMTFPPDPRKNPKAAEVVEAFREKKVEPEGYVLYTYSAIQVWAQASKKAGKQDLDAIVKAMHANEFDTVLGPIRFDEKGDVSGANRYVMYQWKDGKYDYYEE